MVFPSLIYFGDPGLRADVLNAYFCKLGLPFECAQTVRDLFTLVRQVACPIVILALPISESPDARLQLARQLVTDPSEAFPHVFILSEGEPFDAQLEAITVLAGSGKLPRLAGYLAQWMGTCCH